MKTLIVMRHAKSSWNAPDMTDIERPLNDRGRAGAKRMGAWLIDQNLRPDLVLCSSAQRTAETYERLGIAAEIQYSRRLYHADAQTLLEAVQHAQGNCVLLIAHNPGIGDFAERLLLKTPAHTRFFDYPTAATLIATIPGEWSDLAFGRATAAAFAIPADLA